MKKIRVNFKNSKMVDGQLYISTLKASLIKFKLLRDKVDWHTSIVYPGLGKLVLYTGEYQRSAK